MNRMDCIVAASVVYIKSVGKAQMASTSLPDEILLKIFSYFGPDDLCNISKVCIRWRKVAQDVQLWKKHSYSFDVFSYPKTINEVLTVATALDSLIISSRSDAPRILRTLFRKCGYLRKLRVMNCRLGEGVTGLVEKIVDLYPNLQVLSLEECGPLPLDIFKLIPRLTELRELKLTSTQELHEDIICPLVDRCQKLKKLCLLGVRMEDVSVLYIITKLGRQLLTLMLNGALLTDVVYLHFHNCPRLQELEVTSCNDIRVRGMLEGIGSLQELTSLKLSSLTLHFPTTTLIEFYHQSFMSPLVLLNLSGSSYLNDECLNEIAERCKHLKDLTLCLNDDVTDAGMRSVITHCNQLRVLNLAFLSSITGGFLRLVPSHLPHLRRLVLRMCDNVHVRHIQNLQAALPGLNIKRIV